MKEKLLAVINQALPQGGVLEQTVKSGAWMGAMNVFSRGLQIILVIILANLLEPADFGLLGIALLVLSALQKFSELGLDSAVIQDASENVDEYMNTMWVLQLVRGGVLAGILILGAPLVGSVFGEPRATGIVRAIAVAPILVAAKNPGVVYFKKKLNFHREFAYQMSGSLTRFLVTIAWALVSPTVWALVAGLLASRAVRFVFSFIAHEYQPRLSFDLDLARELIQYGKWLTANSILFFLYSEGDDAVVGWLLSATALGFYQTAYRLSNAPATEITQVINSVTFSAFSTLQEDSAAMREAYYKTLQLAAFVTFPAAFGIAGVADVFVKTFMGDQWVAMVPVMQILAVYGLLRSLGKTMGPVFKTLNRPDYITKMSALRVFLLAVLIIPVTNRFGIVGISLLIGGISLFPMFPLDAYLVLKSLDGSYRRFATELVHPLLASVGMFTAVTVVDQTIPVGVGVLKFVLLVTVGVVVYVCLALLLSMQFEWSIDENLRKVFSSLA